MTHKSIVNLLFIVGFLFLAEAHASDRDFRGFAEGATLNSITITKTNINNKIPQSSSTSTIRTAYKRSNPPRIRKRTNQFNGSAAKKDHSINSNNSAVAKKFVKQERIESEEEILELEKGVQDKVPTEGVNSIKISFTETTASSQTDHQTLIEYAKNAMRRHIYQKCREANLSMDKTVQYFQVVEAIMKSWENNKNQQFFMRNSDIPLFNGLHPMFSGIEQ